jgi:uncharacterized ferritin-like protein (DUF455 family)
MPGAMPPRPLDADFDRAGIALVIHDNIDGEYTTMELVARCIYEQPGMPAGFHLDMARQASDEGRHAAALERLAESCGVKYGDLPVYSYAYDALYQFKPCAAGSRDELLWRLLLRATVHEGSSLDELAYQARRRTALQQNEMADLFRYLLADELFHVESGIKWTRYLCIQLGKSPAEEREKARGHYEAGMLRRRLQFIKAHPEEAAHEEAQLNELRAHQEKNTDPFPIAMGINLAARRAVGFTDEDIAQAARWEL